MHGRSWREGELKFVHDTTVAAKEREATVRVNYSVTIVSASYQAANKLTFLYKTTIKPYTGADLGLAQVDSSWPVLSFVNMNCITEYGTDIP